MRGLLAAVAVLVLLPGAAAAQAGTDYFYGELRGGVSFPNDADTDFGGGLVADVSSDTGWLAEGAFGYAHNSGLRGEIAAGYRQNEFDEAEVSGITLDFDGDLEQITVMSNLYYDFNLGTYGGATGPMANLVPFVGGGIGVAFVNAELNSVGGVPINADEDDTVFAWQAVAGLAYNFTPNIAVTASYAYFATSDTNFDGVESEYGSHNVIGGVRFSF